MEESLTTKQIPEGLRLASPLEFPMPCRPGDLTIEQWWVPGLNKAEEVEAAARLLHHSLVYDTWVGVQMTMLVEVIRLEFELKQEKDTIETEQAKYDLLNACTFGLFGFFRGRPIDDLPELPMSGVLARGIDFLHAGLVGLETKGLVVPLIQGQSLIDDGLNIFFPTPELVARVLKAQGGQRQAA